MYPTSFPGRGDGFVFTPGPACTSAIAPVVMSMETNRDSLPGPGAERLRSIVCWAVEQYAST
jgi:hypothetical protein